MSDGVRLRALQVCLLLCVAVSPILNASPEPVFARSAQQTTGCPAGGWTCQDIGNPAPGSQSISGATWNVTASGSGFDQGRFVWKPLPASGYVHTVVTSFGGNTTLNGVAGVMIRPSLTDPQAPFYGVAVTQRSAGGWQVSVSYRRHTGLGGTLLLTTGQVSLPVTLRIARVGVTYRAYMSSGGSGSYSLISGSTMWLNMPGQLYAGLIVSSGSVGVATAGFDGSSSMVAPEDPTSVQACPSDWSCTLVDEANDPSPPVAQGVSTYMGQTWAIDGQGWGFAGAWGDGSDQFQYVYQPFGGSGTVKAQLTQHLQAGAPWDDTGLMIRQSTDGKSPYYMAAVETDTGGGYGIRIWFRSKQGGSTDMRNTGIGGLATTPYLSITAGGGSFSASYSLDGQTWQQVPSSAVQPDPQTPWNGAGYAGMAVTGGQGETAGFGGVTISSTTPTVPSALSSASPSAACHCSQQSSGDPINTADGSFWHSFDDLFIPGRGMPLDFTRTYRSTNGSQDGPLGFGWSDSYNMSLTMDANSNITVHEEGGTIVPFYPSAGTYQAPAWVLAALVDNGDGTMTFTRKNRQQFVFAKPTQATPGQLLKEIDPNGYTTTLTYTSGKLTSVTDPENRSLTFAYADTRPANVNHITKITDPANRVVTFAYDANGNLTDAYDVGRADTGVGQTNFAYDPNHLLLTMTDAAGHAVTNTYDSQSRVHLQTVVMAGGNRATQFVYGTSGNGLPQTTITDPKGNVEVDTYQNYELVSRTLGSGTPQAATWQYSYDPLTLEMTSVTDPLGHTWTQQWDGRGNLLKVVGPATPGNSATSNETTTYQYDPANSLFATSVSVTDPSGVTTSYSLDYNGNLLSVSRPLTQSSQTATTTLSYGDPSHPGDVTQVSDPNNHATQVGYTANGDLSRVTDAVGNVTTFGYDAIGRMTSEVSPRGNATGGNPAAYTISVTYDNADDVTTVTDPLLNQTIYHYDAVGNVTRAVDARQNTTMYTYDEANELKTVTKPDGSSESYTYNPNGKLLSQSLLSSTGSTLRTLQYTYDPLNRVATALDPGNRTTTYGYDLAGRLTSLVDQMNRTTNYGYDELGQLTSISYHDPGTRDVSLSYTALGQRASMTDGTGTSSYTYDSLGRLTKVVNGAGQEVDSGYDLAGNLTSLTYPGPVTVTRRYDAANRMTDVIDWNSNHTQFGYDPNGNLTSETFPASTNGTKASFTYDSADQLKRVTDARTAGTSPFRWVFGYGRDPLGQVSAATDRLTGLRHAYTYDPLNRLIKDQRSNRTAAGWTYDGADNLQTATDSSSGTTQAFCYDGNNNQLLSLRSTGCTTNQGQSFGYNNNGDRISAIDLATNTTLKSYGYNQADELTSYTQGSSTASYTYDGDGLRASKTVNGSSESFTWDVAEGMPLIIQDGSTRYLTGPGGLPIEQVDGSGNVRYYLQDQLGSTRGLIDSSGTVVGSFTFDAWGNPKGSTGSGTTPFGYAGQYTDSESGLQYLRARYYDPATAKFLTVDPLRSSTMAPYAYATDNPENTTDVRGLCTVAGIPLPFGGSGRCWNNVGAAAYNATTAVMSAGAETA